MGVPTRSSASSTRYCLAVSFFTYQQLTGDDDSDVGVSHDLDSDAEVDTDDIPDIAKKIQSYHIPPMLNLRGDGFIHMPALFSIISVPVPIAVGTDLFEIVFSGSIGSYLYVSTGGV